MSTTAIERTPSHILDALFPLPTTIDSDVAPALHPGASIASAKTLTALLKDDYDRHHIFFDEKGLHKYVCDMNSLPLLALIHAYEATLRTICTPFTRWALLRMCSRPRTRHMSSIRDRYCLLPVRSQNRIGRSIWAMKSESRLSRFSEWRTGRSVDFAGADTTAPTSPSSPPRR